MSIHVYFKVLTSSTQFAAISIQILCIGNCYWLFYSVLSDQIRELNKKVDQLEIYLW